MNKKNIKKYIIIAITLILMSLVFPFSIIRQNVECVSGGDVAYGLTEPFEEKTVVRQSFAAQYPYMNTISIAIFIDDTRERSGKICLRLYDQQDRLLTTEEIQLADAEDCVYADIPVKKSLRVGEIYSYTLEASGYGDNIPAVYMTTDPSQHTQGNQTLYYGEQQQNGQSVVRYIYGTRLNWGNIACVWLFMIFAALVVMEWTDTLTNKRDIIR